MLGLGFGRSKEKGKMVFYTSYGLGNLDSLLWVEIQLLIRYYFDMNSMGIFPDQQTEIHLCVSTARGEFPHHV